MKKALLLICTIFVFTNCCGIPAKSELKNGDIVFRDSDPMLMLATGSIYTHCGVVFHENGKTWVYEAIGPVKKTEYGAWIADHRVSVKRYEGLTKTQAAKIKAYLISQLGKKYDRAYNWDDKKQYCSELVWKAYDKAGIKLCDLKKGSDYFAANIPFVKKHFEARGVSVDNYMVSPAALHRSDVLNTVR